MQSDLNKVLIKSMLKKAVKDFRNSPGRVVRNLVDLGVNFSKGRFQKRFLCGIQTMLQNPDSAYYKLFTDIVESVDLDWLIHFGMNLGYNGCTKGAEIIRRIEAEKGFNVPWSLTLQIDAERLHEDRECYAGILEQGVSLGIYTYFLFLPSGNAEELIPLFEGQPDCAFVVFLRGHQITDVFLERAKRAGNVLVSVYYNEDLPDACKRLKKNKLLLAVYQRYDEVDAEEILNSQWIAKVQQHQPHAAILFANTSCSDEIREKVYRYVFSTRSSQKYPVLLLDLIGDTWEIDQIISEDAYVVGFNNEGDMSTFDGMRKEAGFNIFQSSLEDILRKAIKKADE